MKIVARKFREAKRNSSLVERMKAPTGKSVAKNMDALFGGTKSAEVLSGYRKHQEPGFETQELKREKRRLERQQKRASLEEVSPAGKHRRTIVPSSEVLLRQRKFAQRSNSSAIGLSNEEEGSRPQGVVFEPKEDFYEKVAPPSERAHALKRALKDQSHLRELAQHQRHDYEFKLRQIATAGVVRVFNALNEAQRASNAAATEVREDVPILTQEKIHQKKEIASKDAFLSALRHAARNVE